jgi:hypothetical protein
METIMETTPEPAAIATKILDPQYDPANAIHIQLTANAEDNAKIFAAAVAANVNGYMLITHEPAAAPVAEIAAPAEIITPPAGDPAPAADVTAPPADVKTEVPPAPAAPKYIPSDLLKRIDNRPNCAYLVSMTSGAVLRELPAGTDKALRLLANRDYSPCLTGSVLAKLKDIGLNPESKDPATIAKMASVKTAIIIVHTSGDKVKRTRWYNSTLAQLTAKIAKARLHADIESDDPMIQCWGRTVNGKAEVDADDSDDTATSTAMDDIE